MPHRFTTLALGCLVACLGSACGVTMSYSPLNEPPHPLEPREASSVEIFNTKPPTQDYVEVGMIQAVNESAVVPADNLELMQMLREEGAKHGCDGIVMAGADKAAVMPGSVAFEMTASIRAVCIVYSD
jgi:hypothetical protein